MQRSVEPDSLLGSWLHSHEEDTPTTTVYRRAGYNFPPSRGRKGFELRPDGSLTEKGIGPTDRSVHSAGKWQLGANRCLEFYPHSSNQPARVLPIESVHDDMLVVRKESSSCTPPESGTSIS